MLNEKLSTSRKRRWRVAGIEFATRALHERSKQ
jgi:hypothetical protein